MDGLLGPEDRSPVPYVRGGGGGLVPSPHGQARWSFLTPEEMTRKSVQAGLPESLHMVLSIGCRARGGR
jgi:hypothetical protein